MACPNLYRKVHLVTRHDLRQLRDRLFLGRHQRQPWLSSVEAQGIHGVFHGDWVGFDEKDLEQRQQAAVLGRGRLNISFQ